MSVLTFISRRIRWVVRRKIIFPPAQPPSLLWKRFKAPKLKRSKWPIALQKWRHVIYPPPPPEGFVATRQHKHKFVSRRPLKFFFRLGQRHIIFPPVRPAGFIATRPHLHRFNSRRPWKFFFRRGLKHIIFPPAQPAGFIATRSHRHKFISRRPLKFFFKPFGQRHQIFPPVPPASSFPWRRRPNPRLHRGRWFVRRHPNATWAAPVPPVGFVAWHRSLLRFNSRRPIKQFYRQYRVKTKYPIFTATPPAVFVPWHRSLLRFISRRPLKRFFRPKHIIFPPVKPAGFVARPNHLLKVRRRKPYPRHLGRYTFSTPAAPAGMVLQRVWRVYLTRPRR